ncbi:MAG: SagB/ThcOx family dehydrogenase [Candidatus Dadabacteria bacterium]|nr:SagB/ThcOx family dehydrogenase [Candidatus Dadabacteria bacterium]
MNNRKIEEAWKYHNCTKHPGMPAHYMDWENQPTPFKIYKDLISLKIPTDLEPSALTALEAISVTVQDAGQECVPNLTTLGRLLFLSAGIIKKTGYTGGEIYFRVAACTGALYHIDLYIICCDLDGLEAGVYHFAPHDFSLKRLRSGDYRGVLDRATAGHPSILKSPISIVCADTFWRNAWKYQARAYRHTFWDTGTILANTLAAASAHNIPATVIAGFIDTALNSLLGLDAEREAAVSIVTIGNTGKREPRETQEPEPIDHETLPLSRREVDYPKIRQMHRASTLGTEEEVSGWRSRAVKLRPTEPSGKLYPLDFDEDLSTASDTLESTISRRGSTRRFARVPITFKELSNTLHYSTRGIPADFLTEGTPALNYIYIIANDVDGLPSGAYFYNIQKNALELLKEGDFRDEAGHLGLGQDIPADASADVFFLSDLPAVFDAYGNRGYRAAQLEACIIGGRLYLAAYGQRFGASGLTFYDDDVTRFFSPHAEGKSAMFLVALGKSVKRAT